LQTWRKKKGLKIQAAAAEAGVSPATWGHWETGARFPAPKHLTRLARCLRVPVCRLLCADSENCPHDNARTSKQPPRIRQ
jgi:transcriptional regulator with XRE-family HTH domain